MWASLCHFSAFLGYLIPFGNLLFPGLIWASRHRTDPAVEFHGKESLNFQLSLLIYYCGMFLFFVVCSVLFFGLSIANINQWGEASLKPMLFFPFMILCGVIFFFLFLAANFLVVIAGIKAKEGVQFRYPFTIRLL